MGKRLPVFTTEFWMRFWDRIADNALQAMIQIIGLIIAYLVLRWIVYRVMDGVLIGLLSRESRDGAPSERASRLQTLRGLVRSLISYVMGFVFGILLFQAIGFNIVPFITTASVLGLAVGFGAQKLVKDVISGFFLIIDNLFVVGDIVTIGGITGRVKDIGMRVTRIVDVNGRLHQFANGDIGTVTNLSRNPLKDSVTISVKAEADLDVAVKVMNEAGAAIFAGEAHKLLEAPAVSGVSSFDSAKIEIDVSIIAAPEDQVAEKMRVREQLREALLKAQIPLA